MEYYCLKKIGMKRIFSITVIVALILPLFIGILNVENVSATSGSSASGEKSSLEEISVGSPSVDFEITDVDSGITYNLAQFLGKVVLLDLWATWCGPCEISLPYIEQFYKMYPEDVFQVISIDIDNSETDSQVSKFRKSHDMDWIVDIDYDQSINAEYGTGFIPTFYVIDPTGIVRWSGIGINTETFYDDIYGVISTYVPDDIITPTIELLEVTNNTEFSIFDSEVHVTANFSENWNLKEAQVKAEFGAQDQIFKLELEKIDGLYTASSTFELDRINLYGRSSVDIYVSATDYFENSVTEIVTLNLTEYDDAIAPTIELLEVTNNTEFSIFDTEVHVTANFSDNLNLLEAQARVEFGENIEIFKLELTEIDGFYTTSLSFEIDPLELYGYSSVDVYVSATDYFENNVTEKVTLDLTVYIDSGEPVIGDYSYVIIQVDEKKYDIFVQVEVTEDLFITEAYIKLYKGTTLRKTVNLEFFNDTHMEATVYSMYYVDGNPSEYTIKFEITDTVGNIAELEVKIEESSPSDTASFGSIIVFISAIFAIGLAFRKRKR